jgi:hypothetical protein
MSLTYAFQKSCSALSQFYSYNLFPRHGRGEIYGSDAICSTDKVIATQRGSFEIPPPVSQNHPTERPSQIISLFENLRRNFIYLYND